VINTTKNNNKITTKALMMTLRREGRGEWCEMKQKHTTQQKKLIIKSM
jgi:hypothetical protein